MGKIIKNDEGKVVPEKCTKCGGEVVLQIHGEPVYVCKECGKYYGVMPFHVKEGKEMSTLKNIISESVKKVLKEYRDDGAERDVLHWYDEPEREYEIGAMIKSDMNPISKKFKATSIEEAIAQAKDYFVRFSSVGDKRDIDIYYVRHRDFDWPNE